MTLPTDNTQLYAAFSRDVSYLVHRRVKFALSRPDVESELWLRLLNADVLGKFYASTTDAKPATARRLRLYVLRSARNALANIFRTHTRRFALEHVHRNPVVNRDGEDWETWEASLPAPTITPERYAIVLSNIHARWQ